MEGTSDSSELEACTHGDGLCTPEQNTRENEAERICGGGGPEARRVPTAVGRGNGGLSSIRVAGRRSDSRLTAKTQHVAGRRAFPLIAAGCIQDRSKSVFKRRTRALPVLGARRRGARSRRPSRPGSSPRTVARRGEPLKAIEPAANAHRPTSFLVASPAPMRSSSAARRSSTSAASRKRSTPSSTARRPRDAARASRGRRSDRRARRRLGWRGRPGGPRDQLNCDISACFARRNSSSSRAPCWCRAASLAISPARSGCPGLGVGCAWTAGCFTSATWCFIHSMWGRTSS